MFVLEVKCMYAFLLFVKNIIWKVLDLFLKGAKMSIKNILFQLWSLFLLLVLGTLPLIVLSGKDKVVFQVERIPKEIIAFFKGLFDGSSYYYMDGQLELNFFQTVGGYFLSSFMYLLIAGVFVIVLSIIFGIWFRRRSEKGLNTIMGFIGIIPDFILVFLLQLLVVSIYQTTGLKTVRIASSNMDEPAIMLPLVTLFILPFVYLVKSLSDKSFDVLTEDYIRTALSKGNLLLILVNEAIQVLNLIGQLAIFNLFFGGTEMQVSPTIYLSITNEWAGLIGQSRLTLYSAKWIIGFPLLGYLLFLFSLYLVSNGLKESQKDKYQRSVYLRG